MREHKLWGELDREESVLLQFLVLLVYIQVDSEVAILLFSLCD